MMSHELEGEDAAKLRVKFGALIEEIDEKVGAECRLNVLVPVLRECIDHCDKLLLAIELLKSVDTFDFGCEPVDRDF